MSQPARFCIRCGAAVPVADSRFCFSCGAEIVAPDLVAEQSPRPAQEPHEEPPTTPPPSSTPGTEPQGGGIDPIQAVVSGFTRCMELGGRSSRSEFWWFYLFTSMRGVSRNRLLVPKLITRLKEHPVSAGLARWGLRRMASSNFRLVYLTSATPPPRALTRFQWLPTWRTALPGKLRSRS